MPTLLKKPFALLFAISVMLLPLASCGDNDDDNTPDADIAAKVSGDTTGTMECNIMGQILSYRDIKAHITAQSQTNVTVTFEAFGQAPMLIPDVEIPDVMLETSGQFIKFKPTQYSGQSSDGRQYSGTLQGTYDPSSTVLSIDMNIRYGNMPFDMVCTYLARKS